MGFGWNSAYRAVFLFQAVLVAVLLVFRSKWKAAVTAEGETAEPIPLKNVVRFSGVPAVMVTFFCYCALESTAMLWSSSYLVSVGYSAEKAAGFASMFFLGLTAGRAVNGFLTMRFSDATMIRVGQSIIGLGILLLILPLGSTVSLVGLILIGLGCAPIYPCIIHSTPALFGEDKSQAIIGVEMASAYMGTCLMPPLFGMLTKYLTLSLFPWYLVAILGFMVLTHEYLEKNAAGA